MSLLLSLPDEVLKLVMQHVPIKHRLNSCCLVNTRLHAAAVSATDQLWLHAKSAGPGLQWLAHYGQHVTSLSLNSFTHKRPQPLQQLPCANLLDLVLRYGSVQLGPAADGYPGVVQSCTKLTRLVLECGTNSPRGVEPDSLSSLRDLVHLKDLHVTLTPCDAVFLSNDTLPFLDRLTSLSMSDVSVANLTQLGPLTNLSKLGIMSVVGDIALGPSSVPGLVFPASLKELELRTDVEAALLSLVPEGLSELVLWGCGVEGPAEGPGSLLDGMARLQQLERFTLQAFGGPDWPPLGTAYSALVASSVLQSLHMIHCNPPAGMWAYVFPASRKLLHLRCIELTDNAEDSHPTWGAADLSSLVGCCPNLTHLEGPHLQHELHVSELHKLTALSFLKAGFVSVDRKKCGQVVKGLAALTQLRHLSFGLFKCPLTVCSLLPLTSLTALTSLLCRFQTCSYTTSDDGHFHGTQQEAWDTPVWLQLLRRCAERDEHAAAQLAQQLAGPDAAAVHRAVTVDQQRRFHTHQEELGRQCSYVNEHADDLETLQSSSAQHAVEVASLRSQLSAQQQVMAQQQRLVLQQQQQLTVQQQIVAQQGTQIAGLQGQLYRMEAMLQVLMVRQQQ